MWARNWENSGFEGVSERIGYYDAMIMREIYLNEGLVGLGSALASILRSGADSLPIRWACSTVRRTSRSENVSQSKSMLVRREQYE